MIFKLIGRTYSKAYQIAGDNVFKIASVIVFTFGCVLFAFAALTEAVYWLLVFHAMYYAVLGFLGVFALSGAVIIGKAATHAFRDQDA